MSNSDSSISSSVQYRLLSSDVLGDVESITYQAKTKKWSKYHTCVFCEKRVIKMTRHLEQKHQNEPSVAQILLLKSPERRKAWGKLVNDGDYRHNYRNSIEF